VGPRGMPSEATVRPTRRIAEAEIMGKAYLEPNEVESLEKAAANQIAFPFGLPHIGGGGPHGAGH